MRRSSKTFLQTKRYPYIHMTNGRLDVQTKVIVKVEDQFQIVQSILLYRLTITKSTVVELGPVPSYIFKILRDSTLNLLSYRRRIL